MYVSYRKEHDKLLKENKVKETLQAIKLAVKEGKDPKQVINKMTIGVTIEGKDEVNNNSTSKVEEEKVQSTHMKFQGKNNKEDCKKNNYLSNERIDKAGVVFR